MILKELKIQGFRTFYQEATIKFESDITVLTGANDVGKSAILDLISMLFQNQQGSEDDANLDFRLDATNPWDRNNNLHAFGTFKMGRNRDRYLAMGTNESWEVQINYYPTQARRYLNSVKNSNGDVKVSNQEVRSMPKVVRLPSTHEIRSKIVDGDINPNENKLLELAFGLNYISKLSKHDDISLRRQVREVSKTINSKLSSVKPDTLNLEFMIDIISAEPLTFSISLVDRVSSDIPIHLRGTGVKKLLGLMMELLSINVEKEHTIILYDEPENSLHADAQHSFRYVLERFAQHPNIQIVYATHSSSMINTSRPFSLRLLERKLTNNDKGTTTVNNRPYTDENFQMIRTQLGMSPADSLLYAPITVIIEGPTESRGLNRLFIKLKEQPDKYHDLGILSGLIHFVAAGGSNFSKWVEMAYSQGAKPIVFVDGDKIREAESVRKQYSDVPIIHFERNDEFENIVSIKKYFEALNDFIETDEEITVEAYKKWWDDSNLYEHMMFSKRIDRWVMERFEYSINKPQVMDKAIELASLDDIDLTKIDELIDTIRELANKL